MKTEDRLRAVTKSAINYNAIAKEAGLNRNVIQKFANGRGLRFDSAVKIAAAQGYELVLIPVPVKTSETSWECLGWTITKSATGYIVSMPDAIAQPVSTFYEAVEFVSKQEN